jgi:hypothetical protein
MTARLDALNAPEQDILHARVTLWNIGLSESVPDGRPTPVRLVPQVSSH